GCAACGALSLLNQDRTPCGCEADVYGTLSTLALQALADAPVFMADLVDIDVEDDSAVFWHCGLAPLDMADPAATPRATVHSNRQKPLLMEFPLKPGRVTIARFSQARNQPKLMLGTGEMLSAALPFSGTAGTARFDRPAAEVLETLMAEGSEHHYVIAYGDHRPALRALAAGLGLPVLEMC
ncbi:MAG: fucose isomerase, partial [Inquilinus sp.]|nr:fucose isomerase [Inquilinus sp.]